MSNFFQIINLTVACLLINIGANYAQPAITLRNVKKIELVYSGNDEYSPINKKLEIVYESGWKMYQTQLFTFNRRDSTRTFLKNVSSEKLTQLLNIITQRDTTINLNLFPINELSLMHNVDSVYAFLDGRVTNDFKSKMTMLIQNPLVVKYALGEAYKPFPMDDENFYSITVIMHNDSAFSISHLSLANLYDLPWIGNGIKSYNPRISILFNNILGNDWYEQRQRKSLHFAIPFRIYLIYREYFIRKQWSKSQSFK